MACNSCSTKGGGKPNGCKSNGTCTEDSCNKLTVFDWLSNMSLPNGQEPFNCVEVRFKNGRKVYYKNPDNLTLSIGDIVATEASPGHDVGMVTLTGELVKVQMKKKKVDLDSEDIKKIYRKASQKDIDIWTTSRAKEEPIKVRARELAIALNLQMKISDIEFQGDGSKATFFYTADDRVDFRQLIKDYAKEFNIRIEMRQVGFRQEASRLGGIGSCGRELCCSTWLTDFRSVSTSAARYQQLSLNPQKLAGQCGKLKCCLNYELDTYLDTLKTFPDKNIKLKTEKGAAVCQKIDIFKGLMWYAYENESIHWHKITTEDANEIISLNQEDKPVASLEEYSADLLDDEKVEFENVVGQDSLTRFDKPKRKKRKRPSQQRARGRKAQDGDKTTTPQKERSQGRQRNDRSKGKQGDRRGRNENQKQGSGPSNKQGGERPKRNSGGSQRAQKPQGQKPQGQKPQGQKPQGQKPQGQKQQGQKQQGQKPQGPKQQRRGPQTSGDQQDSANKPQAKNTGKKPQKRRPNKKKTNNNQPKKDNSNQSDA